MNEFEMIELLNKRDFSGWKAYHEIVGLEHLYLEDSWVLNVSQAANELRFDIEFVLTEEHSLYQPPKNNERYCYKDGSIIFRNITNLITFEQTNAINYGPDDEVDLGNIDFFYHRNGLYLLQGEWGLLELTSNIPEVIHPKSV
jgi:hypothetical protein